MRVFIVFQQFDYEGAEVLGVYAKEEKAQARIDEERREELARFFGPVTMSEWNTHELRENYEQFATGPEFYYAEKEVI